MEKLVRIKSQGPLQQRNWTNQRGETVVISSVELTMTDGIDTFIGEVTDQQAIAISKQPLDQNRMYGVRCRLETRNWKSEKTGEQQHANSIKVVTITGV
jgi:single-stranded DNA-binding protein